MLVDINCPVVFNILFFLCTLHLIPEVENKTPPPREGFRALTYTNSGIVSVKRWDVGWNACRPDDGAEPPKTFVVGINIVAETWGAFVTCLNIVTVRNMGPSPLHVVGRMVECCEVIGGDESDCNSMRMMGGSMGILQPSRFKNVTFLYPNMYPYNRRGECTVEIWHKDKLNKTDFIIAKIPFNTYVKNGVVPTTMAGFTDLDKLQTPCSSPDMDPLDNCNPVDCHKKYSGNKNFFSRIRNLCIPNPTCYADPDKDVPDIVYVPACNECRDVENSISEDDLRTLIKPPSSMIGNEGECTTTPLGFKEYLNVRCHHGFFDNESTMCQCHAGWTSAPIPEDIYISSTLLLHFCTIRKPPSKVFNYDPVMEAISSILTDNPLFLVIVAAAVSIFIFLFVCCCVSGRDCKDRRTSDDEDSSEEDDGDEDDLAMSEIDDICDDVKFDGVRSLKEYFFQGDCDFSKTIQGDIKSSEKDTESASTNYSPIENEYKKISHVLNVQEIEIDKTPSSNSISSCRITNKDLEGAVTRCIMYHNKESKRNIASNRKSYLFLHKFAQEGKRTSKGFQDPIRVDFIKRRSNLYDTKQIKFRLKLFTELILQQYCHNTFDNYIQNYLRVKHPELFISVLRNHLNRNKLLPKVVRKSFKNASTKIRENVLQSSKLRKNIMPNLPRVTIENERLTNKSQFHCELSPVKVQILNLKWEKTTNQENSNTIDDKTSYQYSTYPNSVGCGNVTLQEFKLDIDESRNCQPIISALDPRLKRFSNFEVNSNDRMVEQPIILKEILQRRSHPRSIELFKSPLKPLDNLSEFKKSMDVEKLAPKIQEDLNYALKDNMINEKEIPDAGSCDQLFKTNLQSSDKISDDPIIEAVETITKRTYPLRSRIFKNEFIESNCALTDRNKSSNSFENSSDLLQAKCSAKVFLEPQTDSKKTKWENNIIQTKPENNSKKDKNEYTHNRSAKHSKGETFFQDTNFQSNVLESRKVVCSLKLETIKHSENEVCTSKGVPIERNTNISVIGKRRTFGNFMKPDKNINRTIILYKHEKLAIIQLERLSENFEISEYVYPVEFLKDNSNLNEFILHEDISQSIALGSRGLTSLLKNFVSSTIQDIHSYKSQIDTDSSISSTLKPIFSLRCFEKLVIPDKNLNHEDVSSDSILISSRKSFGQGYKSLIPVLKMSPRSLRKTLLNRSKECYSQETGIHNIRVNNCDKNVDTLCSSETPKDDTILPIEKKLCSEKSQEIISKSLQPSSKTQPTEETEMLCGDKKRLEKEILKTGKSSGAKTTKVNSGSALRFLNKKPNFEKWNDIFKRHKVDVTARRLRREYMAIKSMERAILILHNFCLEKNEWKKRNKTIPRSNQVHSKDKELQAIVAFGTSQGEIKRYSQFVKTFKMLYETVIQTTGGEHFHDALFGDIRPGNGVLDPRVFPQRGIVRVPENLDLNSIRQILAALLRSQRTPFRYMLIVFGNARMLDIMERYAILTARVRFHRDLKVHRAPKSNIYDYILKSVLYMPLSTKRATVKEHLPVLKILWRALLYMSGDQLDQFTFSRSLNFIVEVFERGAFKSAKECFTNMKEVKKAFMEYKSHSVSRRLNVPFSCVELILKNLSTMRKRELDVKLIIRRMKKINRALAEVNGQPNKHEELTQLRRNLDLVVNRYHEIIDEF